MVSTRKPKVVGVVSAQAKDILPIVRAHIKGQSVSNVYIDGGAQVCVMSAKLMQRLGLEVNNPSKIEAKMDNNKRAKFLGIIESVKVTVFGTQVPVDMYVLPTKGEGYPIILGRPWLIAMKAYQDWDEGSLVLKPQGKKGKSTPPIVYNMKEGRLKDLEMEALEGEWSIEDSSSMAEVANSESESESSLEIMGVVLGDPILGDVSAKECLSDERMEKMLAKDLTISEKEEYKAMLRKHSFLFIFDYRQILGVTVVEYHINLKASGRPVAQKLQRLGMLQQDALLAEVKKLLQAGFIYQVEDFEWVSPVVVTPKKNGK